MTPTVYAAMMELAADYLDATGRGGTVQGVPWYALILADVTLEREGGCYVAAINKLRLAAAAVWAVVRVEGRR